MRDTIGNDIFNYVFTSFEGASWNTAFCLFGPEQWELFSEINSPKVTFPVELSKFRSILPMEMITERWVCALQAHNIMRDMNICLSWSLFDMWKIIYNDIFNYI